MKTTIVKLTSLILLLLITNCTKEHSVEEVNIEEIDFEFTNEIDLNRMEIINRTITPDVMKPYNESRVSSTDGASDHYDANIINQQDHYWTWVARVAPLSFGGENLSTTHCDIVGNKAYVTYHVQGNIHKGALEVVDISNPAQPTVINQLRFNNADINAIKVENSQNIWLAAAHEKHGATLYKVNLDNSTVKRINITNKMQKNGALGVSASANGVDYTSNYLIISSGKTHGGTILLDKENYDLVAYNSFSDNKYVVVENHNDNSTYASLVTGDNAFINYGSIQDISSKTTISAGEITHTNVEATYRGKNTLEFSPFSPNRIYASLGRSGLKVFDINTGEQTNSSRNLMLLEGNTNAVTLDEDYMYIANGADGIAIGEHVEDGEVINPIFIWDQEEMPASANYIKAQNDWIFICKGLGGFNILYKQEKSAYMTVTAFNETGTPLQMEGDKEICEELLPTIFNEVLPERQNAINNHPEYFTHPTKNITIKEKGKVFVTFLHEGAGYKNTFGYYSYPTDNPPATKEDIIRTVIFPNASANRSGGELTPGNTIKLLGEFEAGTEIGFFVIADGWVNGKITEGRGVQHSDQQFNKNTAQQSIIFHDENCNTTYICFEDISIPNGDKDYNDLILQISSDNPNSIDPNDYIKIE